MENYFLFVDSVGVAYGYSSRRLRGIVTASTTVTLHFENVAGGTADLDADEVVLTITAGAGREVMLAILKQANGAGAGVVMVADDHKGEFCHSSIASVAVTLQA